MISSVLYLAHLARIVLYLNLENWVERSFS